MLHCIANDLGLCAESLSWRHYQNSNFAPSALSGALHRPLSSHATRSRFLLGCVMFSSWLALPAGTSTSSFTSASILRTSACVCFALHSLHSVSLALHCFCNHRELSNSDLCFRITRIALPCLGQHVQPCNGPAMLDEQRPGRARGSFQRPCRPPAQLALLQDDIRAALLNVDARPAPASSSDAPAGSNAPRPAEQRAAPQQEEEDEDYAPRRHGRDYDDWDREALPIPWCLIAAWEHVICQPRTALCPGSYAPSDPC